MIFNKFFITGWVFNGIGLILLLAGMPKYTVYFFSMAVICFGYNIYRIMQNKN